MKKAYFSKAIAFLFAVMLLASSALAVFAAGEYATWNEVVDAMDQVLRDADAAFAAGDADAAYAGINDAYYGYYEVTGFERNTMGYISGSRKSEMELQFSACKSVAKNGGTQEEFEAATAKLSEMLREDAHKLDGTSGDESSSSGGMASSVATFLACFGIILREGFEAILVVGAIIAYLVKAGVKDKARPVYLGAILGIALSFVAAWLLYALKLANAAPQEIIEGITALTAVVVLFYVSNWMVSKSESAAWTKYIEGKVQGSIQTGSMFALAFTSFLAVFREGAEVVLFYQPLIADAESTVPIWSGFAVGCFCLIFVYLLIRFASVRLPYKAFFLGTSIVMFIMSISFLGGGIKELIEGDVIGMTPISWIPSNSVLEVLGIYPCVETIVPQLILLAITIVTVIIQLRRNKKIRLEAEAAAAAQ